MATEQAKAQLLLEYVSSGAAQTAAGLETVAKKSAEAGAGWNKLTASMQVFEQMASRVAGTAKQLAGVKELVASGEYEKLVRAQQAVSAELQRLEAQTRLTIGQQQVQSGAYLKQAQAAAVLSKEQQKLADAQRKLDVIAREGKFLGNLTLMQERLRGVGRAGAWGFGLLTVSLGGWIRAGAAGTAEMQAMSHAMTILSRAIANIFAPWIQRVVEWVTQLAARFDALTGAQQKQVRQWVALAAAISGTMLLLPRLIAMLHATTAAFTALGLAKVGAVAGPIGIGVVAAGGLLASTSSGRDALGNLLQSVSPLIEALGTLANVIAVGLGPALKLFSEWLGVAVEALAEFSKRFGEPEGATSATAGGTLIARLLGFTDDLKRAQAPGATDAAKTGLSAAGSGFEQAVEQWRRLQTAASQTGLGPAERTAKATEESLEELRRLNARNAQAEGARALGAGRGAPGAGG